MPDTSWESMQPSAHTNPEPKQYHPINKGQTTYSHLCQNKKTKTNVFQKDNNDTKKQSTLSWLSTLFTQHYNHTNNHSVPSTPLTLCINTALNPGNCIHKYPPTLPHTDKEQQENFPKTHTPLTNATQEPSQPTIDTSPLLPPPLPLDQISLIPDAMAPHLANWGDTINGIDARDTIQIIYHQNIQSLIIDDKEDPSRDMMLHDFHELNCSIFCTSESNVNWKNSKICNLLKDLLATQWIQNHTAFSSSNARLYTEYKHSIYPPGGTTTWTLDHWATKVTNSSEDPGGLGQWSYMTLQGKHNKKLKILTTYKVCKNSINTAAPLTSYSQQYELLEQESLLQTNPLHKTHPANALLISLHLSKTCKTSTTALL